MAAGGGQFRTGASAEDIAAVVDEVGDPEDVRIALVHHRQSRDPLLRQQLPAQLQRGVIGFAG